MRKLLLKFLLKHALRLRSFLIIFSPQNHFVSTTIKLYSSFLKTTLNKTPFSWSKLHLNSPSHWKFRCSSSHRILELLNFLLPHIINYLATLQWRALLPPSPPRCKQLTATINLNTLLKSIIQLMNWGFFFQITPALYKVCKQESERERWSFVRVRWRRRRGHWSVN